MVVNSIIAVSGGLFGVVNWGLLWAGVPLALAGVVVAGLVLRRGVRGRGYLAAGFLIVNAVGLGLIISALSARGGEVVYVVPLGAGTVTELLAPIRFQFSADVAGEEEVGKAAGARVLRITPLAEGETRWASRRVLEFVPRGPLAKATAYELAILTEGLAEGGPELRGQTRFTFETQPLTWTGVRQVGFDEVRRARLALTFDDEIVPTDLRKYLVVTDDRGGGVGYELLTNVRAREVQIETVPLRRDELVLAIQPGLAGSSGPLGTEAEEKRTVYLDFVLALRGLTSDEEGDGQVTLRAQFSDTVDAAEAKQFIRVEPSVSFEVHGRGSDLELVGDFAPATRYRVTFQAGLRSTDGKALREDVTQAVWTGDLPSTLELDKAGGYLCRRGNLLVNVKHANVESAELRISRLYANNLVTFVNRGRGRRGLEALGEELVTRSIGLAGPKNKVNLTQVDLAEILGGEVKGVLLLEVSEEGERWSRDSAVVVVSDLGIAAKRGREDLLLWVNGLREGTPVAGARVSVFTGANQKLCEGLTNAEGLVHFLKVAREGKDRPTVVTVEHEGDASYLEVNSLRTGGDFDTGGRPYPEKGYEGYCYTDRGVYRPGEKVHLAAVVRGEGWVSPGEMPVQLDVVRPDGRVLAELHGVGTAEGCIAFDVEVPAYAPTGPYRAEVRVLSGGGVSSGADQGGGGGGGGRACARGHASVHGDGGVSFRAGGRGTGRGGAGAVQRASVRAVGVGGVFVRGPSAGAQADREVVGAGETGCGGSGGVFVGGA